MSAHRYNQNYQFIVAFRLGRKKNNSDRNRTWLLDLECQGHIFQCDSGSDGANFCRRIVSHKKLIYYTNPHIYREKSDLQIICTSKLCVKYLSVFVFLIRIDELQVNIITCMITENPYMMSVISMKH